MRDTPFSDHPSSASAAGAIADAAPRLSTTAESVLTSLDELRAIEGERQRREAEAEAQRLAAQEAEVEAAARAEEEAQRVAAEVRRREAEAAAERRRRAEREERLLLEQAEHRARIAAELAVQKERAALVAQGAQRRRPLLWGIAAAVLVALAGAGFLVWQLGARDRDQATMGEKLSELKAERDKLRRKHREDLLRQAQEQERRLAAEKVRQAKLAAMEAKARRLADAKAAIAKAKERAAARARAKRRAAKRLRDAKTIRVDRCKNSTDPLCGMRKRGRGRGY